MSAIVCRDVTRRFGELTAVDGVSFTVEDNEIFGIIGPNGAGKTTLLSCIEGLDAPASGTIDVLGMHPIKDMHQLVQPGFSCNKPRCCLGSKLAKRCNYFLLSMTILFRGGRCWICLVLA